MGEKPPLSSLRLMTLRGVSGSLLSFPLRCVGTCITHVIHSAHYDFFPPLNASPSTMIRHMKHAGSDLSCHTSARQLPTNLCCVSLVIVWLSSLVVTTPCPGLIYFCLARALVAPFCVWHVVMAKVGHLVGSLCCRAISFGVRGAIRCMNLPQCRPRNVRPC